MGIEYLARLTNNYNFILELKFYLILGVELQYNGEEYDITIETL